MFGLGLLGRRLASRVPTLLRCSSVETLGQGQPFADWLETYSNRLVRGLSTSCFRHHQYNGEGGGGGGDSTDDNSAQTIGDVESRYSSDVGLYLMDDDSGGHVILVTEDGITSGITEIRFAADAVAYSFPDIWFRDHCRCPLCVDKWGHSRTKIEDLDPNIAAAWDRLSTLGPSISIVWEGGHVSKYPSRWLWANRFGEKASRDVVDPGNAVRWNSMRIKESLQRFDFDGLLNNDDLLFDWLMGLRVQGLAVIQDVPRTPNQLQVLGERVAKLRNYHFGDTFKGTLLGGDNDLSSHTDLPYLSSPPGISLTRLTGDHVQTGGAKLLLSDGFKAADILRDHSPQSFDILSGTDWEYLSIGAGNHGDYHHRARHPVIKCDSDRQITQIVVSDHHRGSKLSIKAEEVARAYESLKGYVSILSQPENVFEYSLEPGEVLSRDNCRVLHKWMPGGNAQGRYEGGYIDWDDITSRIRVLYKRFTSS